MKPQDVEEQDFHRQVFHDHVKSQVVEKRKGSIRNVREQDVHLRDLMQFTETRILESGDTGTVDIVGSEGTLYIVVSEGNVQDVVGTEDSMQSVLDFFCCDPFVEAVAIDMSKQQQQIAIASGSFSQ